MCLVRVLVGLLVLIWLGLEYGENAGMVGACAQKDSDKARTYSERVPDSSIRVIAPHVIDSGAVSSCYIRYGVVFSPQTYLVASVLG